MICMEECLALMIDRSFFNAISYLVMFLNSEMCYIGYLCS